MPTPASIFDESPSLDGPDYVALVIEWDELADDLERQLLAEPASLVAAPTRPWPRALKIAVGVGVGWLALRLVHRLRA